MGILQLGHLLIELSSSLKENLKIKCIVHNFFTYTNKNIINTRILAVIVHVLSTNFQTFNIFDKTSIQENGLH